MKKIFIISQTTAGIEDNICKTKECLVNYYYHLAESFEVVLAIPVFSHYERFHTGVLDLNRIRTVTIPNNLFSQIKIFFKECRRSDLVFIFMPTWRGILCSMIAFLLRKKTIVYEGISWDTFIQAHYRNHGVLTRIKGKVLSILACFMEKIQFKTAVCALVTGNKIKRYFKSYNSHIILTKPIMQITASSKVYKREYKSDGTMKILFVGSIDYRKGLDTLFDAIAIIKEQKPIFLTCIGSGDNKNEFVSRAERDNLSDIISFPGYINNPEKLAEYYKEANIFILTSHSEGMPRVLYEAAIFALPIITTPVGGVPFFWENEKDVLFIEPGNVQDTVSKILRLISNPRLQDQIGTAAQKKVYSFISNPAWKQHSRIINTVLKSKEDK